VIVEDDEEVRESLAVLLAKRGVDVVVAEHGAAALDHVRGRRAPPSVVLLDLWMPVMDGWDLMKAQSSEPMLVDVPIIVITADASASDSTMPDTVRAVVLKPLLLESVLDALNRVWAAADRTS
jgi:CheY-like chemotaxis protein